MIPHQTMPAGLSPYEGVEFGNITKCVHCGLCLDSCPTYRESGLEQDSPRGRLYIMRGADLGTLKFDAPSINFLDRCLDCRACETVCPSKVPYGELIEKTRGVLAEKFRKPSAGRLLQAFFFRTVLPSGFMLRLFSLKFKLLQSLRLDKLITRTPLAKILPQFMVKGLMIMPEFAGSSFKAKHKEILEASKGAPKRGRVALFTGCVADVSDHAIQQAQLTLLARAGYEVTVPQQQACCGALQVHGGDRETGRAQAKKNWEAFADSGAEHIVTSAGGCSAQLKEYHHLFSAGDGCQKDIADFEKRIVDIVELLSRTEGYAKSEKWRTDEDTVIYDAPCHLLHAQKIDAGPRALLASIPGVTLVKNSESEYCCGSAGIYNLLQPALADAVLKRKTDSLALTLKKHPKATTVLTGNPGCLFQIRYGVEKSGLPLKVMHPAEYIASRLA